jgi:hypothetical protein
MKKVPHPARLILCFLTFYFPFVLSSSGQNLSDSEPAAQIFQGVDQGFAAWGDYSKEVELEKAMEWSVLMTDNGLRVVEYS